MPVYGTLTMTTWKIWLACLRKSMVRTCNLIYFPFDDNVGVVKLSPVTARGFYQSSYLCLPVHLSVHQSGPFSQDYLVTFLYFLHEDKVK